MSAGRPTDARARKTREALLAAFAALFFEKGYARVSVRAVVLRAGVARSTFYEHFADKDDLLAASLGAPLAGLVDAVDGGPAPASTLRAVKHAGVHRSRTAALVSGPARRVMARALAGALAPRLEARGGVDPRAVRRAAVALAEAQLGLLAAWVRGEVEGSPEAIAATLVAVARAVVGALR